MSKLEYRILSSTNTKICGENTTKNATSKTLVMKLNSFPIKDGDSVPMVVCLYRKSYIPCKLYLFLNTTKRNSTRNSKHSKTMEVMKKLLRK